MYKDLFLKI